MGKIIDFLISGFNSLIAWFRPKDDLTARVNRYQDTGGLSTKKLNLGLWYVKHIKVFFLAVVWSLVVVAAVLWSFALYLLGNYLFVDLKQDQTNLSGLSQSIDVVRYNFDANLEILDASAISLGDNRYDLTGELNNKNQNVWGEFNYYFLVDGRPVGNNSGFVLPNEKKFLFSFNQTLDYPPVKVVLVLDYFGWRRIDAHSIPDWSAYAGDRLNFAIRDKNWLSGSQAGLSENLDLNQLSFSVTNQTFFAFNQAPFDIVLYNGPAIVSVNRYIVNDFKPKQTVKINLTIVGRLPNISDIVVRPDINILAADVLSVGE